MTTTSLLKTTTDTFKILSRVVSVVRRATWKSLVLVSKMEQANIKPTLSVVGADRTAPTLPMGAVPAPGLPQIVPSIDDQISRPVQVIAHRGGATEAPENTMELLYALSN